MAYTGLADPSGDDPSTTLAALRTVVVRLEASEQHLRQRLRELARHLLEADRLNARLLPAEDEIRRLRAEVESLAAERDRLDAERLDAQRTAAAVVGSTSWAVTAPLRALTRRLSWQ